MSEPDTVAPANAIERVIGAIEVLALADASLRLSEIALHLGIPKSAVHRILSSLVDRGWVEQSPNDSYALTLRMPLLGQRMLSQMNVSNLRQPILDRLADRTRELVRLTELRRDELVWAGSARGRRSGLVYEADMTERVVPFATANGKAWLASLPVDQAIRIALKAGLGARPDLPRAVSTVVPGGPSWSRRASGATAWRWRRPRMAWRRSPRPWAPGAALVGTMSVAAPVGRLGPARIAEILPELQKAAQSMLLVWHTPQRLAAKATVDADAE